MLVKISHEALGLLPTPSGHNSDSTNILMTKIISYRCTMLPLLRAVANKCSDKIDAWLRACICRIMHDGPIFPKHSSV